MQQKLFLFNQKSESTQIVPKVNVMKTAVQTDNISLIKRSSQNRVSSCVPINNRNQNSNLENQTSETMDIKNEYHVKIVLSKEGFEQKEKLGEGSYGAVYKVYHKQEEKNYVVKRVFFDLTNKEGKEIKELTMTEIKILYQIKHKNIIRLILYKEFSNGLLEFIDFAENGDLYQKIKEKTLKEDVVFAIFREILDGVSELHKKKIYHRDLKLENILFTNNYDIKICDFGLAMINKIQDKSQEDTAPNNKTNIGKYEACGSPQTMAPESINGCQGPTSSVDVWAIGCILYYLIYGFYPFERIQVKNLFEHKNNIINKQINYNSNHQLDANSAVFELLKRIFEKDPNKRIKLPEIYKSTWFEKMNNTKSDVIKKNFSGEITEEKKKTEPVTKNSTSNFTRANAGISNGTEEKNNNLNNNIRINLENNEENIFLDKIFSEITCFFKLEIKNCDRKKKQLKTDIKNFLNSMKIKLNKK